MYIFNNLLNISFHVPTQLRDLSCTIHILLLQNKAVATQAVSCEVMIITHHSHDSVLFFLGLKMLHVSQTHTEFNQLEGGGRAKALAVDRIYAC